MHRSLISRRALAGAFGLFGLGVIPAFASEAGDARSFADEFLHTWFVEQNIPKALTMVDTAPVLDEWVRMAHGIPATTKVDGREWAAKFLTLYLYRDHGLATQLAGHADPKKPDYAKLPTSLEKIPSGERLDPSAGAKVSIEILRPPQDPKSSELVRASYVVGVQLPHVPREAVMFLIRKKDGLWKVVGLDLFVG